MSTQTKPSAAELRETFLRFFEGKGHARVASSPIVPANDPTLMFANAGMVQFKDVFTGRESRDYSRATTSQKCIRISGKHNDLENVGRTARHHTFFEMLGNFSFGDYFKRDAIAYAWELFTEVLALPKERMVVSVFGGEGELPADEEAAQLWKEIAGLPDERIVRCGAKDNFWQMGDTGPCGPCSEIHFLTGDGPVDPGTFGAEPTPEGLGWVELWNLVFMQFERSEDGSMTSLPAPSIDTGAGLERLAAVCQGVLSNYDTDLLRPIVDRASAISGKAYTGTQSPDDVSMRVIADHARATAFMIAQGIFPDRDGRSYVLRRVMRRAIRHGHRLGIERLFFHECALVAVEGMGEAYPELVERAALIEEITKQEEERFRRTLDRGLSLLGENEAWLEREGQRLLPGPVAFKLYDTFGFPLDLQEVMGEEEGFGIDYAGFDAAMEEARERSAGSKVGERAVLDVYKELAVRLGALEFRGYEREEERSELLALLDEGGGEVAELAAGQAGEVVVRRTPFYAESGGQVGDRGVIEGPGGRFLVEDTQKPTEGLIVHRGRMEQGGLARGQEVALTVDHPTRSATRRNHSATHLLHWALRTVLGPQAMQKGSLVSSERLRFDYSGSRPLSAEEIARIEDLVNGKVLVNAPIETEVLPMDEAKAKGAIGIFEEKYGEVVRMLRMTEDSIELCGGTHASRTGDIGLFKIVSEGGVAAGVRRIEALTGEGALRHVRELEGELGRAAALLKASPQQTAEKLERLIARSKELGKEIERLKKEMMSGARDLSADARTVDGVTYLGTQVELGDGKALRELADKLRDQLAPAVILLGTEAGGKALLACSVSKELTERIAAVDVVRAAAKHVQGGGGGRADFAQAGGSDPSKLAEAVASVYPAG